MAEGERVSRATTADVARLAGVSSKTVSRVIAGTARVTPQTTAKVIRAAEELSFRPNTIARELRSGGVARTVGFIIGDLTNPFYSAVADGVVEALAAEGLTMVLAATNDRAELEPSVVQAMLERRVRALLLVPIAHDHSYLKIEQDLGTPIVALSRPLSDTASDSVTLDNVRGAEAAVDLLIASGHRRIAFVGGDASIYNYAQRADGYRAAISRAGIPYDRQLLRDDGQEVERSQQATQELLRLADPPTAVFAVNNRAILGVFAAARGTSAPLSLVAFDDFDFAAALGITVVSYDSVQMGRTAVQLAVKRWNAPDRPYEHLELPTALTLRDSHRLGWTPR